MRSTLVWIVSCLLSTGNLVAQAPKRMTDPLFGLVYDSQKIHFERVPVGLSEKCPILRKRYAAAWVYGRFRKADSEYFLISGLMPLLEEETGVRGIAPDEGDGIVIEVQGSKCLIDQSDYFFNQTINPAKHATPIKAAASILTGILQDAFKRYSKAFGGKRNFSERVRVDVIGPSVVRKAFEDFEN